MLRVFIGEPRLHPPSRANFRPDFDRNLASIATGFLDKDINTDESRISPEIDGSPELVSRQAS
jgi:hypothetical protein